MSIMFNEKQKKKIYIYIYSLICMYLAVFHWVDINQFCLYCCILTFDPAKMPFRVMHRKEVTHSNGSYERKSRGRKLADEMGRG